MGAPTKEIICPQIDPMVMPAIPPEAPQQAPIIAPPLSKVLLIKGAYPLVVILDVKVTFKVSLPSLSSFISIVVLAEPHQLAFVLGSLLLSRIFSILPQSQVAS